MLFRIIFRNVSFKAFDFPSSIKIAICRCKEKQLSAKNTVDTSLITYFKKKEQTNKNRRKEIARSPLLYLPLEWNC